MASDLFQSVGGNGANNAQVQQQDPRAVAMDLLKQQNFDIPANEMNNPLAIIQRVMRSGQIPQGRINIVQQMIHGKVRR